MRHFLATLVGLAIVAAPGLGQPPAVDPEQLLSADSLVYFRYDGVEAHRRAYEQTALAELLNGDLGQLFDYLVPLFKDSLGPVLVKNRLLEGMPADQLQQIRKGFQLLPAVLSVLGRNGLVVAAEIGDPLTFRAQLTVVFPQGGEAKNRDALFAAFALSAALAHAAVQERKVEGRTFFEWDPKVSAPVRIAWWQEGKHAVFTLGTTDPAQTLALASGKRPSLAANPLFQSLAGVVKYASAARGYVDFERVNKLVGVYPPAAQLVDKLGITSLKNLKVCFGFEGRHLRTTTIWRLSGPRRGLFDILQAPARFDPAQLPPLPPDVTGVNAYHLDLGKAYDVVLQAIAGIAQMVDADDKQDPAETAKRIDQTLGIDLRKDLLTALGPLTVLCNSPGEGPFSLGYSLVIQVRDEKKVAESLNALFQSLPAALGIDVSLKQTSYRGATISTLHVSQQGFFLLPSYTIHQGWLVIGMYPQSVHGYLLRSSGKYAVWKAPPLTAEVLAAVAKEAPRGRIASLTVSDPRPSLTQLCSLGPFIAGMADSFAPGSFDVGKIPNGQAVTEPLYANVSILVDEGDILRTESYASLSLLFFELTGIETYYLGLFGFQFFSFF